MPNSPVKFHENTMSCADKKCGQTDGVISINPPHYAWTIVQIHHTYFNVLAKSLMDRQYEWEIC